MLPITMGKLAVQQYKALQTTSQCLAIRFCWRLSFVECVAGCEPHVRMIDVHRFIAIIIIGTTSIIAIIITTSRIHV